MDAFAVSVSAAMCGTPLSRVHMARAAASFGFFQFAMPIAGWYLGSAFKSYIQEFDHWLAFALLAFVGGKMILEAIKARDPASCPDPEEAKPHGITRLDSLLLLSFATSLDAMAVGLSYNLIGAPILAPSLVIGLTTLSTCALGLRFGKGLKRLFEEWAEIAGGAVLVLIGAKILLEHLIGRI